MSHISAAVEIDGNLGRLRKLSDSFAIIRELHHSYALGDPCSLTVFGDLMGQDVTMTLKGEIVQLTGDILSVMFVPPTPNWYRTFRALQKCGAC